MDTFLLVDGHSLAFRAYFAMPDSLRDPQGEPVQAVYGFLAILLNQITALNARYVAVAFDVGRSWREGLYGDYKLGRQDVDPAVEAQVTRLKPVLAAMPLACYESDGYEADDIMATLAVQAAQDENLRTVILSGDRDLFGMIGPRTQVLYPKGSSKNMEWYDEARLWERWQVRPNQVADFKALVGDASDNIPGVRGVGEKGAAALLAVYDTLDGIYAHLDDVRPARTQLALTNGRGSAYLSQKLATLLHHVPDITFERGACALQYQDSQVEPFWDALGFRHLRAKWKAITP